MDEKTEELRDIFVEVTETDSVTETQEELRGSIATDETEIEERLLSIVGAMDERYDLETPLTRSQLVDVVRSFYAGKSDDEIARELEESDTEPKWIGESDIETAGGESLVETVARARIELHLVSEKDRKRVIDLDALREIADAGSQEYVDADSSEEETISTAEIAAEFDMSESTARRHRRLIEVKTERKLIGDRFRQKFEHVLSDQALSDRLTDGIKEDGLEDATEGIETDVSF